MLTSLKQLLTRLALPTLAAVTVALPAAPAEAFCGFYVAGADAELYNNATLVVMMRDGTRTVLSMQNDYQGPPEDFALVIPVPVVLQEENVKTLPPSIFDRVDKLAAPRLVEYWEDDPCEARRKYEEMRNDRAVESAMDPEAGAGEHGVKIEAEFEVGEYQIVILSAEDSTGLDTWLREENYNIPEGAEPVLRPYVEGGMKFFVAKVDIEKVKFEKLPDGGERAMLSPLRFHYDSEAFTLPVRLGLINAKGPQDLLVHVVAPKHRYQVANYENVTIPTNLVVKDAVREHFGEFYVSLFDHTLAQNPKAVVTEYAWSAGSCDPCPEDPLSYEELVLLGANLLPRYAAKFDEQGERKPENDDLQWTMPRDFVLTRMHARYDAESLGEDLVFEQAEGLQGGRGVPHSRGKLDSTVSPGGAYNNFQARYAILHFWEGAVQCKDPMWDSWGGPPSGHSGPSGPAVARELAFVDREASLGSYVTASAHEALKLDGEAPADKRPPRPKGEAAAKDQGEAAKSPGKRGCKCSAEDPSPSGGVLGGLLGLGLLGLGLRRRRRP